MKKIVAGFAIVAAAFTISGSTAFAVEVATAPENLDPNTETICGYCGVSCSFVDADGDGICDNYAINGCGMGVGYVDADGDGICDNYQTYGCGMGLGYVDADGDGICDNYQTYGCGRGGRGRGCGRGRWR